jgi:hypothetical protein
MLKGYRSDPLGGVRWLPLFYTQPSRCDSSVTVISVQCVELLNIEQVAERINRSPATIRFWIHSGTELGPLFARIGRRRMARASDVDRWIDAHFNDER